MVNSFEISFQTRNFRSSPRLTKDRRIWQEPIHAGRTCPRHWKPVECFADVADNGDFSHAQWLILLTVSMFFRKPQ